MNYASDSRLDILVLGPMGDEHAAPSTVQISKAVERLLAEDELSGLLKANQVTRHRIHVPEGQNESEIVHNILSLLDTADLVLFDLTPKVSQPDRANVFYELALVQALGIPVVLLVKSGVEVPFYARTATQYRVADFEIETLANALRSPLREFLDWQNRSVSFTNDRVSQFYGLPVVDISAAVGLATGYYYNFLSRLITEGGFLAHYPDLIRQVVYVRPSSIGSTYEADLAALKAGLHAKGLVLRTEKLAAIASDDKRPLWFDHVDGVVIDIPRTIYPLRRSPRLLAMHSRNPVFASPASESAFHQRVSQMESALLDRVKAAIDFQIRHDGPRVRKTILHFTTLAEAADLVAGLR